MSTNHSIGPFVISLSLLCGTIGFIAGQWSTKPEHEALRHKIAAYEEPGGCWSVHCHSDDGVGPPSSYSTREQAAARLMQLLGVKDAIKPQNWPEDICVSSITTEE